MHKSNSGFTIIELLIVMAVMAIVAVIGMNGLGSYRQSDAITAAQKDFIATLRSIQNRVVNGSDGAAVMYVTIPSNVSGQSTLTLSYYKFDSTNPSIPVFVTTQISSNATISNSYDQTVDLCFVNKNLSDLDGSNVHKCNSCVSGHAGFVCKGGNVLDGGPLTVTFSQANNPNTKMVRVEGTGLNITRIYEQ